MASTERWLLFSARIMLFLACIMSIPLMVISAEEVAQQEGGSNATSSEGDSNATTGEEGGEHNEEEEIPPYHALLLPSFVLTVGVVVYYLLSRYLQALPYTAVMFLIGACMGIGASLRQDDNQLSESISMWSHIDSELLLLSFLPGLIFKDSIGLNVHLFSVALVQCLNFAFPMVLAGAFLTALVAWGMFPYGWSFNLAMTFGSILSATDPVAVASLLEEVGAPPRLKVHIGGEALLNDGAAIVFYSIFSARYLYELGVPGVGENVDFARGVSLFFQKSLGGVGVGIIFGSAMLFVLTRLNRRFNREENVVEVLSTLALAYVGYYVADEPILETSGVIATLTAGLLVKFLGRAVINDAKLLDDFWTLLEHLLNTLLFTLGGVIFGEVVALGTAARQGYFQARDWGYLFVLYIMLHVIRLFLFAVNYPLTRRIGLKTNKRETLFQIYGGLRGAVGIALAIALDSEVAEATGGTNVRATDESRKLFGFVGGFAFLTLLINGTTAGPLLRSLHLSDSTETRQKIVHAYEARYRTWMVEHMVRLLAQNRFRHVDFALVRYHVPILADLTKAQLLEAVDKYKDSVAAEEYQPPYLERILPYLKDDDDDPYYFSTRVDHGEDTLSPLDTDAHARKLKRELRTKNRKKRRSKSTMRFMVEEVEPLSMQELRTLFISILKSAYEVQVRDGELEDRQFLSVTLEQSLDFAQDAVSNGDPLRDWDFIHVIDGPIDRLAKKSRKFPRLTQFCTKHMTCGKTKRDSIKNTFKRLKIERALSFMAAHRWAQTFFRREFENAESELSESGKRVINESQAQYDKAEAELKTSDPKDVELVSSHKFCSILLNSAVHYVGKLTSAGLLKDEEAEHIVERLEHNLEDIKSCNEVDHPGKIQEMDEESRRTQTSVISEMRTSHVDPSKSVF
jgi:NhaP-type Na+/H+ or K+/H+ antiporter